MLNPFICGSFHNQEEDDEPWSSPVSTPRKSRSYCKNNKNSKNPYSTRGLDKFSALLAELEAKKQKIYSQIGSQDATLVRFVYSSSNDCVPIVVKVKDQNQDKPKKDVKAKDCWIKHNKDKPKTTHNTEVVVDKLPIEASEKEVKQSRLEEDKKTEIKKEFSWNLRLHRLRRPSYYMPVFIILILLFLVFFGRSVAIMCTSIGWYLVPTLSTKRPTKKKELGESKMVNDRLSFKKRSVGLSPPRSNNISAVKDKLHHQQPHRKSF